MRPVLLIDFGSTRTKVTAVDVNTSTLLGTASASTTVNTDVGIGLQCAIEQLFKTTGTLEFEKQFACSSAAGGLRMVAIGLVPDLTVSAAKTACLGAGAKLVGAYGYKLIDEDIQNIVEAQPDIILLCGGTDGGNEKNILHNAKMLSEIKQPLCPILIAGNRNAAKQVAEILKSFQTVVTKNVMPTLNTIDEKPASDAIREIFLQRIVKAKGLSSTADVVEGILMPTPAAVLEAVKLLSKGTKEQDGLGELVCIDLGGATTDVYSMAHGHPKNQSIVYTGLLEPFAKRTVEGDIGMRYSAEGIVDICGIDALANLAGLSIEKTQQQLEKLTPESIPNSKEEQQIDEALGKMASKIALTRHCGTLEEVFTPAGKAFLQRGKNLTDISSILLTGGAMVFSKSAKAIGKYAQADEKERYSLRPVRADVFLDKQYILSAMGLLCEQYPEVALTLLKQHILKQ